MHKPLKLEPVKPRAAVHWDLPLQNMLFIYLSQGLCNYRVIFMVVILMEMCMTIFLFTIMVFIDGCSGIDIFVWKHDHELISSSLVTKLGQ